MGTTEARDIFKSEFEDMFETTLRSLDRSSGDRVLGGDGGRPGGRRAGTEIAGTTEARDIFTDLEDKRFQSSSSCSRSICLEIILR